MDQADIEGAARFCYQLAGLDGDEAASPLTVASRLAGTRVPVIRTDGIRAAAALARVGSEWRIYIRRGLSRRAKLWLVWHEVAELALRLERYECADVEECADRLAAAMRMPARAFRLAVRTCGDDWSELAEAFDVAETSAALRWGEVFDEPLALVAPRRELRTRGAPWVWPDVSRATPPGARRDVLRDDARRSVVRVG